MLNTHTDATALRFLCCRVGEATYCLNMAWVRGIQRLEELQPQPDERGQVGWLGGEHEQLPVFRLATLLQQPHDEDRRHGKILVLKTQPYLWGLLVDRVDSVIHLTSHEVFPLPTLVRNPAMDFFEGVVKSADRLCLALSPQGLYPDTVTGVHTHLPTAHSLDTLYAVADMASASHTRGKLICFTTAPEQPLTFGLSLSQVPQILRPLPLLIVPGTAAYVLGLVEWRGVPLPVMDLSSRLGGAVSSLATDGRLLVARAASQRMCVGLPIHPQVSIHDLPMAHSVSLQPVPLEARLLRGTFAWAQTTLVIPDLDRILGSPHSCPA
jgi:chemotaxis signal transduction protein